MNLLLVLFQTIISITPMPLIKQYILNGNPWLLLLCLVCYSIMIRNYIALLKTDGLSKVYTIVQILQVLLVVLKGIIIFNEKLTLSIITGIILGLIGVYLIIKK